MSSTPPTAPSLHSRTTLAFCTLLHAFTHAYGAILVPLYLVMTADLRFRRVDRITLIVTIYQMVYFLLSYPAGILADRMNRKNLLGLGLIGNALAIGAMGFTHQYWILLLLGIAAGMFGTLYHPAANALVPAHYPRSPGMALGIIGIGSGIGFFTGAQYAGWRAAHPGGWTALSNWQVPCVELGLAGIVVGVLFLIFARDVPHERPSGRIIKAPMGKGMRRRTLAIAAVSAGRDFAGVATGSLLSIYLQKAHGFDPKRTGWIIGSMVLLTLIATPAAVWLTSGRRRLPGLAIVMIAGGLILIAIPHVGIYAIGWLLPVLALFQIFHLSSYAISEISLVERVGSAVRGRVVGVYLTIAGTLGGIAPFVMGAWTDRLGNSAARASAYILPFTVLGAMMILASLAVKLLSKLGQPHEPQRVEVAQAMELEAIG